MIEKDASLTAIEKFHYLLTVLSKDARTLVESIEVTAANYEVAWTMLQERFENKKIIARTLMDGFLDAEPMRKESYDTLVTLIDSYERNLLQLKKLGLPTNGWSHLLAHLLYKRLDADTQRHWERCHKSRETPNYEELVKFLREHLATLQPLATIKHRAQDQRHDSLKLPTKQRIESTLTTITSSKRSCPLCQKPSHSPFKCESFNKMNPVQRLEAVKKAGLCLNCLSSSHLVRACPSSACRVCGQRHHTMLHLRSPNGASSQNQETIPSQHVSAVQIQSNPPAKIAEPPMQTCAASLQPPQTPTQPNASASRSPVALPASSSATSNVVFLSTAVVRIADLHGNTHLARALLDCCSERNLLSERLAQKLDLHRRDDPLSFQGVGPALANSKQSATARVFSRCTDYCIDLKFHILSELKPILPSNRAPVADWKIPTSVHLADPNFHEPNRIDAIIGAEVYYRLLSDGFVELGPNLPILKETVFGWIVSGKCDTSPSQPLATMLVCSNADLEMQMARFWDLESCRSDNTLSTEERQCESYFSETTYRDSNGRFVVSLPKRETLLTSLGESYATALRRYLSLERRLLIKPALLKAYTAFIHEYIALGHMVQIDPTTDSLPPGKKPYYMPHHCIERPDSVTTKLRVVFDASCASDTGLSLNDTLLVGPVVQDDLYSMLLRFRLQRFAIVADLEKMYRQVWIHPSDRHLQRILWRDSADETVRAFELLTVTYGTASAPFLATRCLQQLAEDGKSQYPKAAKVLVKDFYIDDLLCGVTTEEEGVDLCNELIGLLQSAGFKLHKWASNNPVILNNIPTELRDDRNVLELDSSSSSVKTLGLLWQPDEDVFRFQVPRWTMDSPITKRLVLSDAARLFDPLGLVGPTVLRSKLFMQELWLSKLSWDQPLTDTLQDTWKEFRDDLEVLRTFSIPRWAVSYADPATIELHGFCDASERAYGACLYVRTVTATGSTSVNLLTAKSKVAPANTGKGQQRISLPRLELSSALLLSHLYDKVKSSFPASTRAFFWTDSMIVVHWLAASPNRWKKFVANRVAEIQQTTTPGTWGHVAGIENPADAISRGMSAALLVDFDIWWQGPAWLNQPKRFWPNIVRTSDCIFDADQLEEKPATSLPIVHEALSIFKLKSSLTDLVRIVGYIRRFISNAREKDRRSRQNGLLTTVELEMALQNLVRVSQQESFPNDIGSIKSSGQVKPTSKLKSLSPILVNGILRARGRLNNAPIPYSQKQPMILDSKHPLTLLIVRHYHVKFLHAGPQLLMAAVRSKFWPTRLRNLARTVTHRCLNCFRCKPNLSEQIMADLPSVRVSPTFPFLNTGVDFCGPFHLRPLHRKAAPQKCFVAVFVCMSTKAVHLEVVGDLSTDSFIASLKRFAARRGVPQTIFSDNATNFIGARRTLNEFLQLFHTQQNRDQIVRLCSDEGIQFRFIPPRSPHFGGIWEAAVKSLKTHLYRTLKNALVTNEQMQTVLTQVEACLNSRPLTQLSNDPEDLDVLTPGHFLVHRPLTAIVEPSYEEIPTNRLSQWQTIQEFVRRLWKRWSSEYLSGLQQRTRWTHERNDVHIGTMVLVKDDHLPPMKWRFGRIVDSTPGPDGHVRVVNIRTKDGIYQRAITRICVLPIQDNQQPHNEIV
ncbi:uncharacterized protein LOC131688257 [Topomyia yanbarensis]|nr:uncharacterized protein LOC131688257 [Topomyia yanbarensis]